MKKTSAILASILVCTFILFATGCDEVNNDTISDTPQSDSTETVTEKTLFPSDFADACNGVMVVGSAEYDATKEGIHPIYIFERESETDQYMERSMLVPDAWQKDWEEAKGTELVACLTVKDPVLKETCEFEDEGEKLLLDVYNAKYDVKIFEASTGDEVASTVLDLEYGDCPMMFFFSEEKEQDYPDYKQALTDFVKPHVQI